MSDRLITHGATPIEVPTIAVEPPRNPAQMERAVKGLVDGQLPVGGVHLHQRRSRGLGEVRRVRSLGRPRLLRREDRVRGRVHRRPGAGSRDPANWCPSGEQSSIGLLDEFPEYDEIFDPVNRVLLPRADIATETLAEGLRERGWRSRTSRRTARFARPRQPTDTREMIKTGGFDAVCFTSSSTVRNLVGIVAPAARRGHRRVHRPRPPRPQPSSDCGWMCSRRPRRSDRCGRRPGRARRPVARRGRAAAAA